MARLVGTATQGSADAFVSASVATALSGQTSRAFRVNFINFEFTNRPAAGSDFEVALVRRDKTAMPTSYDVDVICKYRQLYALTTSGAIMIDRTWQFTPTGDLLIVEDPIYLMIDSTSTSVSNNVVISLDYELVTISEVDRLTLLTQSLV